MNPRAIKDRRRSGLIKMTGTTINGRYAFLTTGIVPVISIQIGA